MIVRPTARLIVLEPHERVLLFLCRNGPGEELFWITPGGGVEHGETYESAALRELWEETGIRAASAVGTCVLENDTVGRHSDFGDQEIIYRDRHFVICLSPDEVAQLDTAAIEQASYLAHRWWTLSEMEATDEPIWPEELPQIVRKKVAASGHGAFRTHQS